MPSLKQCCRKFFDADDLYDVLRVKRTSTQSEIKKAYKKVSLCVHPDRVKEEDKVEATEKFQTLGKVYSILSDHEKRTIYDETGEIDEEEVKQDRDWESYWRMLFPKVTQQNIKDFENDYKGSEQEETDLREAYMKFEGDMELIIANVMCSNVEDEQRFSNIIHQWIKNKKVPEFRKFSKENKKSQEKRKKKAEAEAAEAEEMQKELGIDRSLMSMIQERQESRESEIMGFFDHLEAKYGKKTETGEVSCSRAKKSKK